ncbi:hypothetical protein V6N12_058756 [Hibiscus sabdariffa]|uniref:Uncharacterized protein n=1 Tax=Hibiscus sabdariffa TaxID=183260 RepID=A0ABR2ET38_9ROSI
MSENTNETPILPILSLQNVGPGGWPPDVVSVEMDHEGMLEAISVASGSLDKEMQPENMILQEYDNSDSLKAVDGRSGGSLSYASVVALSPNVTGKKYSDWKNAFDNVVVSEANYIIDCSVGSDKLDDVRPSEPSEKKLYGPWMQASSRRRKSTIVSFGTGLVGNCGKQSTVASVSRFSSLAEETETVNIPNPGIMEVPNHDVMIEDAYRASNPEKRSKVSKSSSSSARVVYLMNEKVPEVSTQGKTLGNERHKATTIVEQPLKMSAATGGKIIKERGVRLDHPGLCIRKSNVSSHTSQPELYEWMQKFAKELEGEGMDAGVPIDTATVIRTVKGEPGDVHRAMEQ